MKIFAQINSHRLSDVRYRQWANQFDGLFVFGNQPSPISFPFNYFNNRQPWHTQIEKFQRRSFPRLLINECFGSDGTVKLTRHNPRVTWIAEFVRAMRVECPQTEIWITDCQPRLLSKWGGIRQYCSNYALNLDGLGVQAALK